MPVCVETHMFLLFSEYTLLVVILPLCVCVLYFNTKVIHRLIKSRLYGNGLRTNYIFNLMQILFNLNILTTTFHQTKTFLYLSYETYGK